MTIPDLIRLMENRLSYLNNLRTNAMISGDIEQVAIIDARLTETQLTLDQLKTLT
jgi:hypothetical protein